MKLTALIVEDAIPMTIVLEHTLSQIGIEVVGKADTGKAAIELAQELKPDIITLDTVLPDIIGIEVLKKIKEMEIESKIIFISAAGSHQLINQAMEEGADSYLLKPLNAEKLKEKISELIPSF